MINGRVSRLKWFRDAIESVYAHHLTTEGKIMSERKQEIEDQLLKLRKELNKITDKKEAKKNEKLVGKCFKYRNNYSCPENPSDYWWLYVKVTRLKGGVLHGIQFQCDKYGRIEIEDKQAFHSNHFKNYIEIKEPEYIRAWNKLMDKINSF